MPSKILVDVDGVQLKLSNLDKIMYPKNGFTKGEMIDYYVRISPYLLPHLKGRPLTLKRYPNGADEDFFYQKECPNSRPQWLSTTPVWSESNNKDTCYCVVENLPSLVWVANMGTLELHTSLSSKENTDKPTMMVFDLDPGSPATIVECAQVALRLKEIFDKFSLESFPKTSGSKGLQVYIPINTSIGYPQTKELAHKIALLMEKEFPDQIVSKMSKKLREGKVFIDWSQNDQHKTTVCVYSLRAREEPTVSTPVTWAEVEKVCTNGDARYLVFDAFSVLERVGRVGDLFSSVLTTKQYIS